MVKLRRLTCWILIFYCYSFSTLVAQNDCFVSMFDGKTMNGWKMIPGHAGHWRAADCVIEYDGKSGAKTRDDMNLFSEQ